MQVFFFDRRRTLSQTQNVEPMLFQYWAIVEDDGPALKQYWVSVSRCGLKPP